MTGTNSSIHNQHLKHTSHALGTRLAINQLIAMYVFVQAVRGLPYSLEGCEFISLDFLSPRNQKKLLLSNDLYLSLETH